MMPDLGKYAGHVLAAYVVSLGLIAVLVGMSLRQYLRVRSALREVEERNSRRNG